ncbi:MAG: hypothetical protein IJN65_05210 [Clostridia bacterium]|nr:hypothetical protein [Clostridia bacterium]
MKYNQNVLSKTRQALFKSGVHYASVDESLYKTLKIGYILFFLWAFFINVAHVLSYALKISGNGGHYIIDDITLSDMKNSIIFIAITTFLLIGAYVFAIFNKHIVFTALSSISCLVMFFHFKNIYAFNLSVEGIKSSFYTRHVIPLAAMFIIGAIMGYIGIKQSVIEKKAYIKFVDGLYEQFKQRQIKLSEEAGKDKAFVNLTEQEWKDYINAFADAEIENQTQSTKRSVKIRQRKEKEE